MGENLVNPPNISSIEDKLKNAVAKCQEKLDKTAWISSPYYWWFFNKNGQIHDTAGNVDVKQVKQAILDMQMNLHYAGCHRAQLKDKTDLNNLVWGESMTVAVEEYNEKNTHVFLDEQKNLD